MDGVLDVNGWDIRKMPQLLMRSNAVVVEWLTSPVWYRIEARFVPKPMQFSLPFFAIPPR